MRRVPTSSIKHPIRQISGGALARQLSATPPKRQIAVLPRSQPVECRFCHNMGYKINECRLANNLCLVCGSAEHWASQCPHRQQVPRELISAPVGQQKLTVSGLSRPMIPFQSRQPLPPQ